MKCLILGCNGQLGTDCEAVLRAAGNDVVGLDLPNVDITSAGSLAAAFDAHSPDVVVNCAAYTAVDKAESDVALCRRLNAEAPGLIGAAAKARGIKVIHVSTDYVFPGDDREPPQAYVESDPPSPRSVYGETKLAGELALAASGAEAAILRTAWLYGRHGKNFPKTMLRLALAGRSLRVVEDQWGTPTWSFRLAQQIAAVAGDFRAGVFHATGEGYANWREFAQAFLRMMEVPADIVGCSTEEYPTAARRPHCSILENRRLKELGLNVMRDWREDLRDFVALHRAALIAEQRQ